MHAYACLLGLAIYRKSLPALILHILCLGLIQKRLELDSSQRREP